MKIKLLTLALLVSTNAFATSALPDIVATPTNQFSAGALSNSNQTNLRNRIAGVVNNVNSVASGLGVATVNHTGWTTELGELYRQIDNRFQGGTFTAIVLQGGDNGSLTLTGGNGTAPTGFTLDDISAQAGVLATRVANDTSYVIERQPVSVASVLADNVTTWNNAYVGRSLDRATYDQGLVDRATINTRVNLASTANVAVKNFTLTELGQTSVGGAILVTDDIRTGLQSVQPVTSATGVTINGVAYSSYTDYVTRQ